MSLWETWSLDLDNGWAGELVVGPEDVMTVEGDVYPVITLRLCPNAAERLIRALEALDEIGELMHGHSGEGPDGHVEVTVGLAEALHRLVEQGRLVRLEDDHGQTWHDIDRTAPTKDQP